MIVDVAVVCFISSTSRKGQLAGTEKTKHVVLAISAGVPGKSTDQMVFNFGSAAPGYPSAFIRGKKGNAEANKSERTRCIPVEVNITMSGDFSAPEEHSGHYCEVTAEPLYQPFARRHRH
jgi:hypothetical protein